MTPFLLAESADAVLTGGQSAAFLIGCAIVGLIVLCRLSCVMWDKGEDDE